MSKLLTPARLAMLTFFIQSAEVNNFYPRIPDIQHHLGIGPADLAVAMLGMPVGGFFGTMIVARLIERLSARGAILIGFCIFTLCQFLPGWAWNVPSLTAVLFLMGGSYVMIDIATNVEVARIQNELGRRIMATCHGFWSLGSMLGAVMGFQFAQFGIDTRWHLLVTGLLFLPLGLLIASALPQVERQAATTRAPVVSLPSKAMIGLCIFTFGVLLAELTTRNWGAVYLREVIGTPPGVAAIAFGSFSLFMAIGRLSGDYLTDRFGPVALGRFCAATAVIGVLVLLTANNIVVATIGFGALGIGVSIGFPLAVTAAAGLGDRAPAVNVAALALIAYIGSIVGPPLVGFVAQGAGLRWGFAAILPLMILSALFGGSLRRRAAS
ncbi:MAG TPA: MFS transporter [Bauldia sp.]|nr:MFS transporter [Bauldia sp.]